MDASTVSREPDLLTQAHDLADRFVTGVGRAIGIDVNEPDEDLHPGEHEPIANVRALPAPTTLALPAPAEPVWEIRPLANGGFLVTDGKRQAHCPTRAFADQVLVELGRAQRIGGRS